MEMAAHCRAIYPRKAHPRFSAKDRTKGARGEQTILQTHFSLKSNSQLFYQITIITTTLISYKQDNKAVSFCTREASMKENVKSHHNFREKFSI